MDKTTKKRPIAPISDKSLYLERYTNSPLEKVIYIKHRDFVSPFVTVFRSGETSKIYESRDCSMTPEFALAKGVALQMASAIAQDFDRYWEE